MDINSLIVKALTGDLTEEEKAELDERIARDPSLQKQINQLADERDLYKRYEHYCMIDAEGHRKRFFKENGIITRKSRSMVISLRALAAAVVAALVVVSALLWKNNNSRTMSQVAVSKSVSQQIRRLEQSPHSGATLRMRGEKIVSVASMKDVEDIEKGEDISSISHLFSETDEATIETWHEKEFWMVLDDGTCVHLNFNSSLTYPIHFQGNKREVTLKGDAYFIVASDDRKPFIVHTPQGDIKDYGTEFYISTTCKGNTSQVVLIKGKIGVSNKGKETLMKPGQLAEMAVNQKTIIRQTDVSPYVAWNTGQFYFDGAPLEKILDVIGKWYGKEVRFMDHSVKTVQFSGILDKYSNLPVTLKAIAVATGLNVQIHNNIIIINKR